ncbi:HpcH/HpaI aldolase/citrate lyase family protein [Nonomuraea gerenzanensis]|uniref:Citrate lyase beta chain n=1 Tax=Nonomuraea gerenzanensis TaxID=93944 RepID=A0A1M4E5S2_9ACTN|nr:CoA ester lyase [Nonomuraea gerenzanensis]UBU16315.1 CoA ester lyase [Nonomuraea gerenzanensis]SBO94133.1 Citrate lyase beta chain [Nonomuraea gerenzanensis]
MSSERPPLRSLLFVPGTKVGWLAKAEAAGADAAILDLEDAVPPAGKAAARARVADAVASASGGLALLVRINPLDGWAGAEDLRAVAHPRLTAVVLPKVHGPADVRLADRLLSWCEREQGLPDGHIGLVPLLETATALREAYQVARAAPRVAYLGAITGRGGDVERAIGYRWSPSGAETLALRARVLLDARAAAVPCPVAGLWTDLTDLDGLRAFAEQNRALGYEGMIAVHPSHVPVINEVFSPGPEELARYQRLIAAVEQAQADGAGAIVFEGDMVDEAMAARARAALRDAARTTP